MSARYDSNSGRYEYPGYASDLPALEGWQEDALAEMPRCEWCHTRTDKRAIVRHTTDGRTLHFCNTECQHDYYTDWTR